MRWLQVFCVIDEVEASAAGQSWSEVVEVLRGKRLVLTDATGCIRFFIT